jgi:hypothetical protein
MNDFIDAYCERLGAGFWAEPTNALTNLAFLVAAYLLYQRLRGSGDVPALLLTLLIGLIGMGSFLFHTYATVWASLADVLPIVAYMMAAIGIGLKRRFGLPTQAAALGAVIFVFATTLIMFSPFMAFLPSGSVAYLPALIVLALFAISLTLKSSEFAVFFVIATPIFALSLFLRTLDAPLCDLVPSGTHFAWHVLNAVTLYLVTWGLVRDGTIDARAEERS